jgi:excisionase family DNA binding protein
MSDGQRLGRIFGPDTLELLDVFVREQVEATLSERDAERRWMSPEGAADYLGVSASAIRKRIARGTIRYSRMGRRLLVDRRALDAELEKELR